MIGKPVNPEQVFARVDAERESGELAETVTSASVKYQSSTDHPGLIERINENGIIETGSFVGGRFSPF
jgi:hypothetical protein